jgi:hypothetical protein
MQVALLFVVLMWLIEFHCLVYSLLATFLVVLMDSGFSNFLAMVPYRKVMSNNL